MPGIYISDGGGTASALGNALGGLSSLPTALGPQAAAEAQLLRYRTEGQDITNQQAYEILRAREAAEAQAGGLLGTYDANPPGPSGSVANTAASLSQPPALGQPPGQRTSVDLSGDTPTATYAASRLASGDLSPADLSTLVTLGQSKVLGPGNTYAATATRSTTPLSPGQVIDTTGQPGGPTISGGSGYTSEVERTGGASDPAQAKTDVAEGAQASANLGKAQMILALYDQYLAPQTNPTGVLSDEALKKLSAAAGMNFTRLTPIGDVKNQIRSMFASMVANMRDSQGQPMFRGGLDQIMNQFPDPEAEPARFRSALEALSTSLQRQTLDGQAALEYLKNPSPQAYNTLLTKKGQNAAAEGAAYANAGLKIGQEAESEKPAAAPAAAPAPAPPAPAPAAAKPNNIKLVPDIATGEKLPSGSFFRTPDGQLHKVQ